MRDDGSEAPRARDLPIETVDTLPERVEVVVVGGGIAGASVLHHLAGAGVDVLLVDRGTVGGGATGAAVGVLSPPMRQPFHETARDRGEEEAVAIWRMAHRSVTSLGEALTAMGAAAEAELDLSGGYVLAEPYTVHEVERSFRTLNEAGFPVTWLDGADIRERTRGRGFVGGMRLEGGGALNPAATARLLVRGAAGRGARVAEGVKVDTVDREQGRLVCRTSAGPVQCEMVVYAVHTESRRFSALLGDEIVPIRGQALAAEIAKGELPDGGYTTHWKLNVWRRSPKGRVHLGGWRHDAWDRSYWKTRPEVDTDLQDGLLAWFRAAFPGVELRVTSQWSGIYGWTADYLPLVGALPGTTAEMVVSGFSGGGLPFAFECGRIMADIVKGRDPGPEAALLAPRRFGT